MDERGPATLAREDNCGTRRCGRALGSDYSTKTDTVLTMSIL
jgi:hypothetical protein